METLIIWTTTTTTTIIIIIIVIVVVVVITRVGWPRAWCWQSGGCDSSTSPFQSWGTRTSSCGWSCCQKDSSPRSWDPWGSSAWTWVSPGSFSSTGHSGWNDCPLRACGLQGAAVWSWAADWWWWGRWGLATRRTRYPSWAGRCVAMDNNGGLF